MRQFQVGDVLQSGEGSIRSRVVLRGADYSWFYDLNSEAFRAPFYIKTDEVTAAIYAGESNIEAASGPAQRQKRGNKAFAEIVFKRLAPILDDISTLMTTEGRENAYQRLKALDTQLARSTYKRLLHAYFLAGGIKEAIISGRSSNGKSRVNRNVANIDLTKAKLQCLQQAVQLSNITPRPIPQYVSDATAAGKPRVRRAPADRTRFRIDEFAVCVFIHYFGKLSAEGMSLKKIHRDMCKDLFVIQDALGNSVYMPRDCIPSLAQFKNWYHELTNYKEKRLNQVPEKSYSTEERELTGNEYSSTINAGDVGSGDATIWNVGLRSRFSTREIIGPPVVFRIRDKKTGMLLGLSVSLEAASWRHFASAIANCFEDKVAFCAKYDVAIQPDEWPVQGIPKLIEADCGESDNTKPEDVCREISLGFKNVIFGRPDLKPGVESDFHTLQVAMNGDTPGTCVQQWQARGKHEWRTKAVLDIDQFMRILILIELEKMRTPREKLRLPDELIASGANSSSLSAWNWHVENRGGGLRTVDARTALLTLMEKGKAKLTGGGIIFKNIIYSFRDPNKSQALAHARRYGDQYVTVAFDYRLADEIFILRTDGSVENAIINLNHEHQRAYQGKTFREVRSLADAEANIEASHRELIHASSLKTRQQIQDVIAEAEQQTAAAALDNPSLAKQLKNLKTARSAEEAVHSPENALYRHPTFISEPQTCSPELKKADQIQSPAGKVVEFPSHGSRGASKDGAMAALLASMPSNRRPGNS